jgi:hypothetical protein
VIRAGGAIGEGEYGQRERPAALGRPLLQQPVRGGRALQRALVPLVDSR